MDANRQAGIYVGGHVSKSFTLEQAISMGLRTVEHARMLPLACSEKGEEYSASYRDWVEYRTDEAPNMGKWYRDIMNQHRTAYCQSLLRTWADADSYYVPTYLTRLTEAVVHTGEYRQDARSAYIPQIILDLAWQAEEDSYRERFAESPQEAQDFLDYFHAGVNMTGMAHAAGVKLLVGTDLGDTLIYPGFSFHDEMALYVEGGVSPADTLVAATLTAAEFTGVQDAYGSVDKGKRADLVFLRKNPLDDIKTRKTIHSVFYQQRFYDEKARESVLATVRKKARGIRHHLIMGWVMVSKVLPLVPKYGFPGDGSNDGSDNLSNELRRDRVKGQRFASHAPRSASIFTVMAEPIGNIGPASLVYMQPAEIIEEIGP